MDRAVALRALVGYAIVALTLLALSSWARGQSVDNAHALDEQAIELFRAGKFKKALDLSEQALALREKMLGPNDPDLAESLGTVAKLYMLEGRLADAEPYLSRAVGIVEKAVGRDHPAFGVVLNMLGELYIRQGRHDEAEATLKRALANLQNAPNLEDQLGLTLNNLAVLYQKQERIPEATRLIERAMTLREHALGPTHPEVARLIDSLGVLYTEQGDHVKAEALLKRALTMREQVLGHEHLEVGYSLSNLGNLYLTLGHLDEAKDATKRAISILQGALPAGHPDIATITNNLANIYEAEGKSQEAEATYRQVLSMREKLLPPGHPEIAQSVGTLSTMAFERQDWARALELVRQASRMWIALSRKTRTIENSELKRSSQLFRYHVLVAHRAGANDGSLLDETFEMAQWADRTAVAASLVAMSARQATGNGSLAQLIRLIQDYEKWRDATERAIIDAQGRGDN